MNNNNNDLNSISLGNMGSSEVNNTPVSDLINNSNNNSNINGPVDSLGSVDTLGQTPNMGNDANNGVIGQDNVGGQNINTNINTPPVNNDINGSVPPINSVPPIMDVPQPINDLNVTPFMNEIGTVPPIPDAPINIEPPVGEEEVKPKKKGMPKIIFVLIVVLALAAVGVGVYIVLGIVKNNVSVVTKEVEIEVNGEISDNIDDYATFTGIDSSECSLDTSGISDTSTIDKEYNFVITCNDTKYTGKAKIVDTVAPNVEVKEVSVGLNENVEASNFIDGECDDETECTYEFEDEEKIKEYLAKEGTYKDVVIIIKDEAGNETKKMATLTVKVTAVGQFLDCNKSNGEQIKLGLNDQFLFNKSAMRYHNFTLSEADYNKLKTESADKETITYNNVTGEPLFNDDNKTLVLIETITYEDLVKQFNKEIPENYAELLSFFNDLGYSCKVAS